MDEPYQYPVSFKCDKDLREPRKKVEAYFRIHRRSGGGDCGALTTVSENVYRITFRYQKDQQEVLRRSRHNLELADGRLELTVQESLEPPTTSHSTDPTTPSENPQAIAASSAPPSGEKYKLQLDDPLSLYTEESKNSEKDLDKNPTLVCGTQLDPSEKSTLVMSFSEPAAVDDYECFDGYSHLREHSPDNKDEFYEAEEIACLNETLPSFSLSEGNTAVASYNLCDGLQVVVCQGDITTLDADALVSAANEDLNPCEGVAAALCHAGGPNVQCDIDALVKYNRKIPTGQVVVTTGGNLKCKKLLHAVGPVAGEAGGRERMLLERTVENVLNLAEIMKFKSIAMPCISSGVLGVPVEVCSEAIATAVKEFSSLGDRSLSRIILIDDSGEVVRAMQVACDRVLQGINNRNDKPSDVEFHMSAAGQNAERGAAARASGGRICVEIVQGFIETQQVDVLVSPMVGNDPCSTRVGNILNEIVGSQMASMFRKAGGEESFPGDSVLLEGLPGLPSTAVLFLNLMPWNDDLNGTEVEVLRVGINNILTSCEKRGFGSVALPVLGAGIALQFPTCVVARVLLEQLHAFEPNRASSTPLVVRIVIHPDDEETSKAFESVQETLEVKELTKESQQQDQHQDQQEVLWGSRHNLELADGRLELTVQESLEPPTTSHSTDPTTPSEAFESVQEPLEVKELTKESQQQDQHKASATKRIILLGKTGSGKSHLANTIFGEDLFTANYSPNSETKVCQAETKTVSGRSLTLIDTPGVFDTEKSEVDLKPEIMSCITECAPGPHAFLIVLRVDKFSKHEQEVIDRIWQYFSEDALNYAVIVFTHGDQLPKGVKIEDFVSQSQKLSDLVKRCGGRCHVFDNKYWKNSQQNNYRSNCFQLEALLCTIDEMVMEKHGCYYTNDVLQNVEEKIQKQEAQIRESSGTLSPAVIRKQAKTNVANKFLIQLAAIGTGTLLGAFFGVSALVDTFVKVVKNPTEAMKLVKHVPAMMGAPVKAAGGEVALATGVIAGVTIAGVATGGVVGGMIGHDAAKGAKTPMEAVEMAAEAVKKKRKEILKDNQNAIK